MRDGNPAAALSTPERSGVAGLATGAGPAAAMGIGKWVRKLLSEEQAKEHARATGGAVRRATTVAAEANRWLAGLHGSTAA